MLESDKEIMTEKGFTMVEITIVMVIIGFIIGGIVVGRGLIRASEINSITSDLEKFKGAVDLFNKKYNALPGDMYNAQDYWGAAADCTSAQTTIATCNGDGDGMVEAANPSGTIGNEVFLFWKHLANAELIQGNFNGVKASIALGVTSTSASNAPSGKISGSLWYLSYLGRNPMDGYSFNGTLNHTFEYGLFRNNLSPKNLVLTAEELYSLDMKIDDGKPGTGALRAEINTGMIQCAVKSTGSGVPLPSENFTAIYNVTGTGNACVLNFVNAF